MSPVHAVDPRAKLVACLAVALVAVSSMRWPVWAACALMLAGLAVAARVRAVDVWSRARIVLPVVLLAALALPFVRSGGARHELGPVAVHERGLELLAATSAKATIGLVAAVLLAATTTTPALLAGLRALRVPAVLVLIASLMHRYAAVVVAETGRVRLALLARGYRPRHALQGAALGRATGALLLRSHGRGERVHLAMLARGHRGELPLLEPLALRRVDVAFAALIVAPLVIVRIAA